MAEKRMLRGKAPLTTVRGAAGSYLPPVYKGQVIDPVQVDATDRDRLVEGGFLQWVEPDGSGWRVVDTHEAVGAPVPELVGPDPGSVNPAPAAPSADASPTGGSPTGDGMESESGGDLQARLKAARAELPADGSAPQERARKDVQVAWLTSKGYDPVELDKQNKADLVKLVAQVKNG